MIHRFVAWLKALWRRAIYKPAPVPAALVASAPPRAARSAANNDETHHFRGAVLDQMERYIAIMKRARHAMPGGIGAFHSKYGAYLLPGRLDDRFGIEPLDPFFLETRPSMGMVMYTDRATQAVDHLKRTWVPAALYFQKYATGKAPVEVQPVNGEVYTCGIYWDKLNGSRKFGTPTEFAVSIDGSGIRILRMLVNVKQHINVRRGAYRGTQTVHHRRWGLPEFFTDWARQNHIDTSADDYLRAWFIEAANHYVRSAMGSPIRVRVSKDGVAALLAVDMLNTPDFFRDRDITVTSGGARRRVFHAVRTHVRRNGTPVRMHFRGERRFTWNGFNVEISVPGRDHIELADFSLGLHDSEMVDPTEKVITPSRVADRFLQIERNRAAR